MTKLDDLKKWLKESQDALTTEFEKRYSRISKESIPMHEQKVPETEPDLFVNLYKSITGGVFTGNVVSELSAGNGDDFSDSIKIIGTYKLVKID